MVSRKSKIKKNTFQRFSFEKNEKEEQLPKWYIIKIDHIRENYVMKQIEDLIQKSIILEYRKVSEISNYIIKKYRFVFIKTILTNENFNIIKKMTYTYGFYPSNSNFHTFRDLENYKPTTKTKNENISKKHKEQSEYHNIICGQFVNIINGFFSGSKGKVLEIIGEIVSLDVEFYGNSITTEVHIKDIAII